MTGRVGQSTDAAVARAVPGKGGKGTVQMKAAVAAVPQSKAKRKVHIDISAIWKARCDKKRIEIARLWRAGLSQTEIARRVGYRPDSIRRIARQMGLIGHVLSIPAQQSRALSGRHGAVTLPSWPDSWPRSETGQAAVANLSRKGGWK